MMQNIYDKIKSIYYFLFPKPKLFAIWLPKENDFYRDVDGKVLKGYRENINEIRSKIKDSVLYLIDV